MPKFNKQAKEKVGKAEGGSHPRLFLQDMNVRIFIRYKLFGLSKLSYLGKEDRHHSLTRVQLVLEIEGLIYRPHTLISLVDVLNFQISKPIKLPF